METRFEETVMEVICVLADTIQDETLDYMLLALPPSMSQWSEWLRDPPRLLTILSRFRWQLVMTHVSP